jgi:hypothetical protein
MAKFCIHENAVQDVHRRPPMLQGFLKISIGAARHVMY